ncbi:hypothetical protein L0F63_000918 [Massospora cicadina]|nr:hypothetical protein L0F63_000918 [Massospora cicadina]
MPKKKVVFSLKGIPTQVEGCGRDRETRAVNDRLQIYFEEYARATTGQDPQAQLTSLSKVVSAYLQYDHLELDVLPEFSSRNPSPFSQHEACAKKYYRLASALNCGPHRAKALEALCTLYLKENRFDQALQYATEMLDSAKGSADKLPLAQAHKLMGDCYLLKGEATQHDEDFKSSERHLLLTHGLIEGLTDFPTRLQSETLINLGILLTKARRYPTAYNYLKLALRVATREAYRDKNPTNQLRALTNLSILFKQQENFVLAIHHIRQELEVAQRFKVPDPLQGPYWDLVDATVKTDALESLPPILHAFKGYLRTQCPPQIPGVVSRSPIDKEIEEVEKWQATVSKILRLEKKVQETFHPHEPAAKDASLLRSRIKLATEYAKVGAVNLALKVYREVLEAAYVREALDPELNGEIIEELLAFLAELDETNLLKAHQKGLEKVKASLHGSPFSEERILELKEKVEAAMDIINEKGVSEAISPDALPCSDGSPTEIGHEFESVSFPRHQTTHRLIKVLVPSLDGTQELTIPCPFTVEKYADFHWLKDQTARQFKRSFNVLPSIAYFFSTGKVWGLTDRLHKLFSEGADQAGSDPAPIGAQVTAQVDKFAGYRLKDFKDAYLEKVRSLSMQPNPEILNLFDSGTYFPSTFKLQGASINSRALPPLIPLLSNRFHESGIGELCLCKTLADDSTLLELSKVDGFLPRLISLDFSNTLITSASASTLLECFSNGGAIPKLASLDLSYTLLDDQSLTSLCSIAKLCPALNYVGLDGNDFSFSRVEDEARVSQGNALYADLVAALYQPADPEHNYTDLKLSIAGLKVQRGTATNLFLWLRHLNALHPIVWLNLSRLTALTSGPLDHNFSNPGDLLTLCLANLTSVRALKATHYSLPPAAPDPKADASPPIREFNSLIGPLHLEELDLSYYTHGASELSTLLRHLLPRCPRLKHLVLTGCFDDSKAIEVVKGSLNPLATPDIK